MLPFLKWNVRLRCFYLFVLLFIFNRPLAKWVECSPMVRETEVLSQVESYQRLKKWYLMMPWKGVAPSPTPRYSSLQDSKIIRKIVIIWKKKKQKMKHLIIFYNFPISDHPWLGSQTFLTYFSKRYDITYSPAVS